ncbi:hypothetical protein glysoja_045481, partial [Glycine soja]
LVKKHRIDLLCLQETKREQIDNTMCQAIWGDVDVSWEMQPASNTAGGLLCLWSENSFKVERKVSGRGFIFLEGVWTREAQEVHIVNIYAPCDIQNKRALWESLRQLKNLSPNGLWCLLGDFDSVRNPSERVGISQRGVDDRLVSEFNDWIADLEVEEPTSSTQYILDKNFLDHHPVLFNSKNVDWGPKPFRILDCWLKDKSFGKIVNECWTQTQQSG